MGVGSVDGNPLKFLDDIVPGLNVYSDILQHIPGVSSIPAFKGGFGLSGKMSGNGMPVKVTFYDDNDKGFGFYFCGSDDDCPSGFTCSGICAGLSCRADQEQHGLLCYEPCPSGWKHILGVCYAPCKSGYTDGGLLCTDWEGNCDAGEENDAGLCYSKLVCACLNHWLVCTQSSIHCSDPPILLSVPSLPLPISLCPQVPGRLRRRRPRVLGLLQVRLHRYRRTLPPRHRRVWEGLLPLGCHQLCRILVGRLLDVSLGETISWLQLFVSV
jgi:hypothetical protein